MFVVDCCIIGCASVPWFCNHSQSHSFFLVIVSFVKETCKSNVSTTAVKDSDLAKHHSDFESSSSVDCSNSSACDSDTKYYQRTFTVVDPTAGAHDRHRDSRNWLQLLKTMQMPFDPAMMFLDLLHKQMLSGT